MVPSSRVLFSLGASNITTMLQIETRVAACLWKFVFVHSLSFCFCIPAPSHTDTAPYWKCIYLGAITAWGIESFLLVNTSPGTSSISLLGPYEGHSKLFGPHFGDFPVCCCCSPGGRHTQNSSLRPWMKRWDMNCLTWVPSGCPRGFLKSAEQVGLAIWSTACHEPIKS